MSEKKKAPKTLDEKLHMLRIPSSSYFNRLKAWQETDQVRAKIPPLGSQNPNKEGYSLSGVGGSFTSVTTHFDDYDNVVGIEVYEEGEEISINGGDNRKIDELPKKVFDQLMLLGRGQPFPMLLGILPTGGYVGHMDTSWWERIRNSTEYRDVVASMNKLSLLMDSAVRPNV